MTEANAGKPIELIRECYGKPCSRLTIEHHREKADQFYCSARYSLGVSDQGCTEEDWLRCPMNKNREWNE